MTPRVRSVACAAVLGAVLAAGLAVAAEPSEDDTRSSAVQSAGRGEVSGELRLHLDPSRAGAAGPLAAAAGLAPGLVGLPRSAAGADLELRGRWQPGAAAGLALQARVLLSARDERGKAAETWARSHELHVTLDRDDWQFTVGKKLLGWDVGYGFRPNDVVQQEQRRTLLAVAQPGRPLLMAEHFDAETATAWVWVNPQHQGDGPERERFAGESALALRWFRRDGPLDLHLTGRVGQHTRGSVGASAAWVATDALALHASARWLQRHDGWVVAPLAGGQASMSDPWSVRTLGVARQLLVGAQWTGELQQSVLVEAWHDGTAQSRAAWRDWSARNAALVAAAQSPGLPAAAVTGLAGNLAWQTDPLAVPNLHRDQVFVRLAWQPDPWLWSLDVLGTPADRGRLVTAGLEWRGDRWRVNAAWRVTQGPAGALLRLLPVQRQGVLAATRAF